MLHTSFPRVKVCCIGSVREAWTAIAHGASAIGLVSEMPSGPGVIEESLIREIARAAPPAVATFLLTCKQDAPSIIEQQRRCGANTIQICDRLERGSYDEIRAELSGIKIVQVIHVCGEESVEEAMEVAARVDAILLYSGNQKLAVKELGGTGRTHDWRLSRRIVESVAVPVFLAGGLRAENVREAFDEVRPFGLDVCSGVRTNGHLDEEKLARMFEALRETAYQSAI